MAEISFRFVPNKILKNPDFQDYKGSEDNFQKSVAQYLDMKGLLWFHTPNGGSRNKIEASKLKGMGVKPGVPDCMICEPFGQFKGLAIELKVGRNTLSENQVFWLYELWKRGWKVVVSWSLDEVVEEVNAYLSLK